MSDFEDLCDSMGLSIGDPDAIDKLIDMCSDDDHDDSYYDGQDTDHIKEINQEDLKEGDEIFGNFYIYNDKIGIIKDNDFFIAILQVITQWDTMVTDDCEVQKEMNTFEGLSEGSPRLATSVYRMEGEIGITEMRISTGKSFDPWEV